MALLLSSSIPRSLAAAVAAIRLKSCVDHAYDALRHFVPTAGHLVVAVTCTMGSPSVAQAQSPFKPGSGASGRSFDSAMPNEAVNPFSGSLSIVETDLVLPGNAGLDVRVQRVYSSAIYPGYQTSDLTIEEDSWAGIGWKLQFGRVRRPAGARADGAAHRRRWHRDVHLRGCGAARWRRHQHGTRCRGESPWRGRRSPPGPWHVDLLGAGPCRIRPASSVPAGRRPTRSTGLGRPVRSAGGRRARWPSAPSSTRASSWSGRS